MKLRPLRKFLTFFVIACLALGSLSACSKGGKDEGGKGDATSDGTDGSAENSNTPDDLVGTDTSDASGEGNEVEGEDVEATIVTPTVMTDSEIRKLVEDALGKKFDSIYNLQYQEEVENQLELLQKKNTYNLDKPLFVLNPYGTNRLGMYVYLNTDKDSYLEYTISVDQQDIADFTRHMYSEDAKADSEHEAYIIGLVPGVTNTVTFRSYDSKSKMTDKYVYSFDVPNVDTITQPVLDMTQEGSLEELAEGLYTVFEIGSGEKEQQGHILFYDNAGVVRSEIPLDGINANSRLEFVDGNLLYACSDHQFALVDPCGKVEHIYAVPNYRLHHDFDYDADEDCIIALATNEWAKTQEDCVLLINLETSEFAEIVNFNNIFPEVSKKRVNSATDPEGDGIGWIQLNSIQIMDTDSILVSSRALNSIIKIDNIRENPEIAYILSEPTNWEGTQYTTYLFNQNGEFNSHEGQYNITYLKDDSLDDGQYYIHMFNNSSEDGTSYFYQYLIDEDGKTYELTESFTVPASKYLGSTQKIDGNTIVCSGSAKVFGEYDAAGNLIASYSVEVPKGESLYRVYKYRMDGYWFN